MAFSMADMGIHYRKCRLSGIQRSTSGGSPDPARLAAEQFRQSLVVRGEMLLEHTP
jgi:hypothetical protein